MITRMLLSLKKTSAKNLGQDWGADGNDESILDPPSSPRVVRGSARFLNPTPPGQVESVISIPMEVIHIRDERYCV